MDLDLLPTETYYEGTLDASDVLGPEGQGNQWMGGVVQTLPRTNKITKPKKTPANPRGRQSTTDEGKKRMSHDDVHGMRQRGRPRLDTRDETATEVRTSNI